mmetsp:Transcript_31456/g.100314  ORF Transcript_31456/g.100314 Transcript_31456/m.100314 type:complete len:202 (+) Transcript_31456:163-768(+)
MPTRGTGSTIAAQLPGQSSYRAPNPCTPQNYLERCPDAAGLPGATHRLLALGIQVPISCSTSSEGDLAPRRLTARKMCQKPAMEHAARSTMSRDHCQGRLRRRTASATSRNAWLALSSLDLAVWDLKRLAAATTSGPASLRAFRTFAGSLFFSVSVAAGTALLIASATLGWLLSSELLTLPGLGSLSAAASSLPLCSSACA